MPKSKKKRGSVKKPSKKGIDDKARDKNLEITSKDSKDSNKPPSDDKDFETPDGQEKPKQVLVDETISDLKTDVDVDLDIDIIGSGPEPLFDTNEADLRAELESELKRLQEEFKRQKQITEELERKRDKVQLEGPEVIAEFPKDITGQTDGTDLDLEVNPRILDSSIDQSIGSDFEIDIRFIKSIENIKTDMVNLQEQIESKLDNNALDELRTEQVALDDITEKINKFEREFSRMEKVLKKTDEKLDAVLMDLGFEESLNINKVPNYILVMVYETILNDVINRIKLVIGAQDTEEAVHKILEDVRSHTSGGELFKYEHNKISIPELKQYLDNKMISPRQIHLTFNSIVNRLIEYVPGYTPKNFKAMIKIMSQEYAVETTAKLEDRFNALLEDLNDIKGNINKFMLGYKDKVVNQQFYEKEMKNVNMHIGKLVDRIDVLPNTIEKNLNEIIGKKIEEKISELDLGNIINTAGTAGDKKLIDKDKTNNIEEPKPIFSSGVIELGEDTSFDEDKNKDKDKDVVVGELSGVGELGELGELGEESAPDEDNNIDASKENKQEIPAHPIKPQKSETESEPKDTEKAEKLDEVKKDETASKKPEKSQIKAKKEEEKSD